MSRNTSTSDANVVQEGLHKTQEDGNLSEAFDPRTGKWGRSGTQESLNFDFKKGKLTIGPPTNPDNVIAIPMAAAGYFTE